MAAACARRGAASSPTSNGDASRDGDARISYAAFEALLRREMAWVFDTMALSRGATWAAGRTELVATVVASRAGRAGDTISGPTLFAVADLSLYATVLSSIGEVPLALTIDASVHFLKRPRLERPIVADARLLKSGKRLCVGSVDLLQDGALVAHCVGTYSVPPAARREDVSRA